MSKEDTSAEDLLGTAPAAKTPAKKASAKAPSAPAKEAKPAAKPKAPAAAKEPAKAPAKPAAKPKAPAAAKEPAKAPAKPAAKKAVKEPAAEKAPRQRTPMTFEEGEREKLYGKIEKALAKVDKKKGVNSRELAEKLGTETRKLRVCLYTMQGQGTVKLKPGESKVAGMMVHPA